MKEYDDWKQIDQKQANMNLKKDMDDMIEAMILQARLLRAKYDALIAENFTEEQALELCKKITF